MIQKCDFKGCEKLGNCRCPKNRELKDYWHFCQEHAAEYNKNWNYYAGMTEDEIDREWEKDTFGEQRADGSYTAAIRDFLAGKTRVPEKKKSAPTDIARAFNLFGLPSTAGWGEVQKKYRALAKAHHPDASKSKDQSRFIEIGKAYALLKKFFGK
ncbi:MAG: DnaJ domain-containing protein [Rickettsiales bacterium]|jgi:DnaJ-domain-containing protein 1|nr:DnaJ domain-containing protein [Rickettsiales bacterium]